MDPIACSSISPVAAGGCKSTDTKVSPKANDSALTSLLQIPAWQRCSQWWVRADVCAHDSLSGWHRVQVCQQVWWLQVTFCQDWFSPFWWFRYKHEWVDQEEYQLVFCLRDLIQPKTVKSLRYNYVLAKTMEENLEWLQCRIASFYVSWPHNDSGGSHYEEWSN